MKTIIPLTLVLSALAAILFYFGGVVLLTGLGAISLLLLAGLAFFIGHRWTLRTMQAGAQIAIDAASNNDRHDAQKIQALSGLTREAIKARQADFQQTKKASGLPALPAWTAVDGQFTIAGLDDEPEELRQ